MRKVAKGQIDFRSFSSAQSLVEILVGLGVIAVVFTSVVSLIFVSLKVAKVSRERSLAQSLINHMSSAVKSLANDDWHSLWSANGGVIYLSLDEGAGSATDNNLALDELSGFNATIKLGSSGNTSLASAWLTDTSCRAGQCLSLDNVDDYLEISDTSATSSPLDLTTAMTFSAWIYPTDLTSYDPIFAKVSTSTITGYELANSSGGLRLILKTPSATCDYSAGSLSLNTWQHVVATYNGAEIRLYLNGQLVGSPSACTTGAAINNNAFLIGARATDTAKFSGRLDELRIYSRALTAEEISGLYSGVNQFYPVNNAGLWQLKHGKETLVVANIEFTRSFHLERVLRDANNNIVSTNGNSDPLTKKVVYLVEWGKNQTLTQEEYLSRNLRTGLFTQTDWSGGAGQTEPVFTATNKFDSASSSIIFNTQGELSSLLAQQSSGGGDIDGVYRWAWNDAVGWIDFWGVAYSPATGVFSNIASSSAGGISMNCVDTSCASSNYKVYQATSTGPIYTKGDLYGYAWSDNLGWFSFNCNQTGVGGPDNCSSSNYKVYISQSTGDFNGYAWNDVIGWVSFNCADLGVCLVSDYKVRLALQSASGTPTWLISSIFDTQKEKGVTPVSLIWQGSLPTGTEVKFQLASSNSPTGPWNFVGADGTANSYYPASGSSQPNVSIPITNSKLHHNKRYLRYKVFLTPTTTNTPTVNDISVIFAQ